MEKCPKSIFIRLGLVHVVVVEWLSLKETDEQGNQLTDEGNHDCCLVHETLLPNELMMAVGSYSLL